ncbi:MAG: flavodoxin family protein [Clostridia bacterium]|jgi:multimeric flavodoxin WrbA|nr:flavodoxin family protein [Lachnospiraceae bacterium]NCB99139.1 flavodoxin family protein [Clostridia bacterium]NCD02195.1 flavodoxin family protein [Clostridia bacterium]
MKKIIAINASPRVSWNTGTLVREAAKGAESMGAEVKVFDLYKLEKFTGCISCFGCKLPAHKGICIYKDGLAPVLEEIRSADGLIIGSPNYLGDVSAAFRALYERLIFQSITYKIEQPNYNEHKIPVLFIMTSNAAEEGYSQFGYDMMVERYENTLNNFVGPVKVMISGNTLQVKDYHKYDWTMFNGDEKKLRHEEVFPIEKKKAFDLGCAVVKNDEKSVPVLI